MIFADFSQLLSIWKDRLGLTDWRIILILGGCTDKEAYMEIEHSIFYQRAIIHVNPWLVGEGEIPSDVLMREALTDDFIESSLVHELLHMYTRNLRAIINTDLEGVIQRDLHQQLINTMERADEQMIDKLAEALVRAFTKSEERN